ncbi:Formin-binding protein 4 [Sciurus carolinensis]|uniref:Formin-binding protein 4 n=1 Tax=Sciurus carolinensis TaxID=30640 RepID=A0AA41N1Y9_SCICA|nr:Formin-binding protein 4 [Sciurus carolinensis]
MGKKSRAVPGRRPILQLSPPGPRSSTPGRDPEPEPDTEPDSTAAASNQLAPPAAAATTTTPAVTASAAADDSPSEDEQEVVVEVPRVAQNPPKPVMTTRPTAVKATGGLCLLGAYADSDDDESDVSEKPAQSKEANGNQSADIDSTLANFLAEIDAITAPQPAALVGASAPPPTPPRPEPKEAATSALSSTSNGTDSTQTPGWQYDTQCSLAGVGIEMGDWQEVWDENTGCYYYWNTQTNEVTWELPQYLATQVQGLQHYQPSFVVNTDTYTKEKAIPVSSSKSGPGIAKREVKKEVNEGIQALSNNEEEKKGVAASLLAPLLPEGIKEEEERWRRKVICKEVEPISEVKEASTTVEEAATTVKPQEVMLDSIEDPSQEDLCSVVQSGESEEEEEQDTLELELVLERKKAELRALEEGDGSVSGSSPRSDISQPASQDGMRRLMSKRGKWKMFVRATSPESTSRSSSKTGRETPENGENAVGAENSEKIDENSDKEIEVEESSEKIKVQTAPKVEEEQDLKFQIGELANTLTSKFEFLGINRQSISNFHVLLLQTETRIADWREGALNGNYLKRKLQDAAEQLKQYEINATPKGWSCHWDRDHRRYFYVNEQSGESQWEFPDGEEEEEESQAQENRDETLPKPTLKDKTGTDSNSTESSENSTEDGEIQEVEMEDEGSEEPPAPGTEEDTPLKPSAQPAVVTNQSSVDSTVSSSPSTKAIKRKATEISTAVVQRSATIGSSPVLYSQSAVATGHQTTGIGHQATGIGHQAISVSHPAAGMGHQARGMSLQSNYLGLAAASTIMSYAECSVPIGVTSASLQPAQARGAVPATAIIEPPPPPPPPPPPTPPPPPAPKMPPPEKTKKGKKEKAKKSKTKMPSLVKKWQSIQRELDEEENSSSSEEDRESTAQKRIEEWKQQQLVRACLSSALHIQVEAVSREWVPPQPEYFYQPTGNEKVPEIVGEEKGTVVYHLDSVPTEGSYFTGSRVGGKRGIIKEISVTLQGPEDNTLLFESRFESGNLQKAVRVDTYEYELTLRTDLYTNKHTQWFYFRVQNTRKDVTYRFTIVNLLKPKSLYAVGMKPLMYSQLDANTYNIGWRREGDDIKYYKNNTEDGQQSFYCLTWTIQFPHDQDTCFFAHFYPYTYTDLQCYLLSVAKNPIQSQFCKLRTLCRSLAGNTVYLLTITNPSLTPHEAAAKKAVVLSARVHPGESNASWIMKGFLDFILSNSPDAQLLRDIFVFKVVPMLNPDGVIVGNYRCSLAGRDLNRHYQTLLKESFPCIWHTRNMIKRLLEEREVLLYCDFHGHSRKNNIFLYGCNNNDRKHWLHERVFPLMLSKNAPDKFTQCLAELRELLQQEIHKKFNELGEDVNLEGNWSDISLSDIESSTSGSDSSLSDGLPVHLLNIVDELNQKMMSKKKKKKPLQTRKQRNEKHQKNKLMPDFTLTEEALERAELAPTLQKQPTFYKNLENSRSSVMKNEKLSLGETQLSGRERNISMDPQMTLILRKNKEKMQSKKSGFTASCPQRGSTDSSHEPAPGMKPNWPRNRNPVTKRSHTAMAAYPSLHINTYP